MKRGHTIVGSLAGLVALSPFVLFLAACKSPADEEIRKTIEIVDVSTKWVAKEYKQWPQAKLTLVPTVSFRVRNLSSEPLRYVNFNGIFKEKEAAENLGDNFLSAIRGEPVLPGALSPVITLKSNFGVEGKRLDDFKNNPHWKTYFVKIFVQMKGSRHVLMGEWPVSRIIDFKEDQPVHMGGEKKEPDKK